MERVADPVPALAWTTSIYQHRMDTKIRRLAITTELDSLDESLVLLSLDILSLRGLAQDGDNCDTRVSTDDGDVNVLGVGLLDLGQESGSSDNIKSGDTEKSLLVENVGLLEDLGEDWDGGVDGVGDDENVGFWSVLGDRLGKGLDDRSVGVLNVSM